jgi:hypothetical protein
MDKYQDYKTWCHYGDGKYRRNNVIINTVQLDSEKADNVLKDQAETQRRISILKEELKELESILSKIVKERCQCGVHESVDNTGYDDSCTDCGLRW